MPGSNLKPGSQAELQPGNEDGGLQGWRAVNPTEGLLLIRYKGPELGGSREEEMTTQSSWAGTETGPGPAKGPSPFLHVAVKPKCKAWSRGFFRALPLSHGSASVHERACLQAVCFTKEHLAKFTNFTLSDRHDHSHLPLTHTKAAAFPRLLK